MKPAFCHAASLTADWASTQGLDWSASGTEIWFTAVATGMSRALYAVTPAGRLRQVASAPGGMLLEDVSRDGQVLFVQENVRLAPWPVRSWPWASISRYPGR